MEQKPIRLEDCYKTYTYDQDKVFSPSETVARFKKRLEEVDLDILKEVRRIDNGRLDIPIYFSVTGKDARDVTGNKKQMGKGCTPEQSQASACMELGERFSFFSFMKNPDNFIVDTYPNLKAAGYNLMPIKRLLQSVHDEIMEEEMLEELLADIPIQWTWATNLNQQEEVLIPFSWFYAINEFNGPSNGNSYEESICQGICEIIERHVCSLVSHEKRVVPRIRLDSAKDPVSRDLIDKFIRNGIEVYLNDFTLDTGVPTISAFCIDPSTFPVMSEIVWLEKLDMEVFIVNTMHPQLKMTSIYTIVPGAHFRERATSRNAGLFAAKLMAELVEDPIESNAHLLNMQKMLPDAYYIEFYLGRNLFALDRQDEALIHFNKALEMNPSEEDVPYIYSYIGNCLKDLEQYREAIAILEKGAEIDNTRPDIHNLLGFCHFKLEEYENAVSHFSKTVELNPSSAIDYANLGVNYRRLEKNEEAIKYFELALSLDPSIEFARDNLSQLIGMVS